MLSHLTLSITTYYSLCVSIKQFTARKLNRYMCVSQEERKREWKKEQMMVGE
jgi:hypothetical protein